MKNSDSRNRRKVLTGLIATITVNEFIPSKWTKPIINTVFLPAHAQTSSTTASPTTASPTTVPPTTTTSCPRNSLTLPGMSLDCGDNINTSTFYKIDDNDPCNPFLLTTSPESSPHTIYVMISFDPQTQNKSVDIDIGITGVARAAIIAPNGCPGTQGLGSDSITGEVLGSSGLSFSARGSISATPSEITFTDILLTPT